MAEFDSSRKNIILFLLAFVIIDSLIGVFLYGDSESGKNTRNAVTNIEVCITSGLATSFALLVVIRQGLSGLHGKTYAALAIGMASWFMGELIWTYGEVMLGTNAQSNSLADVFWLTGYGFLGYNLAKMYAYFDRVVNKWTMITISTGIGFIVSALIYQIFLIASFGSVNESLVFMLRTAYPIGDFIILVPSIVLMITLKSAKLHFSPSFFIALSLFITGLADIVFSYVSLAKLSDAEWMAAPIYNFAYLGIAGALYWYNRFVIFDEKRFASKLVGKPDQGNQDMID